MVKTVGLLNDELKAALEHISGKSLSGNYQTTAEMLHAFNGLYKCKVTLNIKSSDLTPLLNAVVTVTTAAGEVIEPGADGKYLLDAGSYKYSASCDGYESKSNVSFTISANDVTNGTKTVNVTLTIIPCVVTFDPTPDTATIVVKNASLDVVQPGEGGTYSLAIGNYTYTASNEGYTTQSDVALPISLEDVTTGTKTVTVTLEVAGE